MLDKDEAVHLAEEALRKAEAMPSGPEKDAMLEASRNYTAQAFDTLTGFEELDIARERTLDRCRVRQADRNGS